MTFSQMGWNSTTSFSPLKFTPLTLPPLTFTPQTVPPIIAHYKNDIPLWNIAPLAKVGTLGLIQVSLA